MTRRATTLDGEWWLRFGQQDAAAPRTPSELAARDWPTLPATVPGNVELDLIRAGRLPAELERGNNVYLLRALETHRWWYGRSFVSPDAPAGTRAEIVFEGIDCLAEVFVNGRSVGTADNMLIAHRFDVTDVLRPAGEANELAVRIDSAVLEGRRRPAEPLEFAGAVNWEALRVRKAPHMYGWDILPRIVSAGLWRGVRVEVVPQTRFRSVYFATLAVDAATRAAQCVIDWDLTTDQLSVDGWQLGVSLHDDAGQALHEATHPVIGTHGRSRFDVCDVRLWWPRGAGEAALYELVVTLRDGRGRTLDEHRERVGVRRVELVRTDTTDAAGSGEFVFVVNGRKVFARGTNHVPLDALHGRDPQHLPAVVEMLADLNCNMVRCWGGNVYEDQAFFDACDERGIMVWQDFALACASYPQDDAFATAVRHEAEAVVAKLRNHASLVLWAGNNEIDELLANGGWSGLGVDPNEVDRLCRQVLAGVTRRLDPYRPYLPSSPYWGPGLTRQYQKPEDHLWGPRDDYKGAYYTSSNAHFVSEIGYHGCPDRATLERMTDREHLWPWQDNDQWLTHAVRAHPDDPTCNSRIQLMANQVAVLFGRVPDDLDDFVFASQASQAEAMKFFVERWRMGKWRRTGMLWWNLRDGWPVISDAVVDYYGRRKLAYHYLWRAQRDVIAAVDEPHGFRHALTVVNDTASGIEGDITVGDADTGRMLYEGRIACAGDGVARAGWVPQVNEPAMWLIDLRWRSPTDGHEGTYRGHYLAGSRPVALGQYRRWVDAIGHTGDAVRQ